jgi:preprotein translocase subunit SecA
VIPTNRPIIRLDNNDRIYKTRREKYNAVIDEIKNCYAKGQPVWLVLRRWKLQNWCHGC